MPKIKNVFIWKKMPSDYQAVEYIQSSGTQWINTGITPNDATYGFECKFNITNTSGDWGIMMACTESVNHGRFGFAGYSTSNFQTGVYGTADTITTITPSTGVDYIAIVNYNGDGKTSINGTVRSTLSPQSSMTYSTPWTIFCYSYGTNSYARYGSFKLYYMKIYHGTTLVREFVPCYRKSDSVIGLYDLVGGTFYINQGTGTFTKGSDISDVFLEQREIYPGGGVPSIYQEVEYIQNTGTSYINTDYIPTVDTEIETDISWGNQTETRGVFWGVTGNDRSSDGILGRIYDGSATTYNPRFCNSTYSETRISITTDTFHKIILKKNGGSVDGVAYSVTTNSTPYQSAIDIFAGNNGGSHGWRCGQCKIKTFKISEGGTLKRNFIPCYRKSDNVIGMYDAVGKQFYTNSGSGTFTKGPNV